MKAALSPRRTLRRFGFKQTLKGALIIGVLAGFMLALQGVAYEKAYPDAAAREKFATSLAAAPSLGFIYGDPANLSAGTAGYMVYRVLGFMGVVTGMWALMTTTKLLRGSEEDGRWETVLSGAVTNRTATRDVITGFSAAWALALVLSILLTLAATTSAGIDTTIGAMSLLNLAIFLPGLLFGAVGMLTSQLALTRQRALLYGAIPIAGLFLLRGIGNTSHSLHWLLNATPFGWAELINPVRGPQAWWLVPFIAFSALFIGWGLRLTRRDYGSSVIAQTRIAKSHYGFLRNAWQLALRQNAWILSAWAFVAFVMIGLIAGLTTTAINATKDSGSLSKSIYALAGSTDSLKVAFLGAGMLFMVMVLLLMSITIVGGIRKDEAKQYLDNILVAPQRRVSWLVSRLLLGFGIVLAISLVGGLLLYGIASGQHVSLDIWKVLATSVCVVGTVGFLMGLGTLLYGLLPRLTVIAMYVAIGWSFLIILLSSAVKLNTVLLHSSLFEYTSFNLAAWPDWATLGWMIALGIVLAGLGILAFNRRDIVAE